MTLYPITLHFLSNILYLRRLLRTITGLSAKRSDGYGIKSQYQQTIPDEGILAAAPDNYLFQHEYGHYIQSQKFGIPNKKL